MIRGMHLGRLFWKFLFAFWGSVIGAGLIVGLGLMLLRPPVDELQLRPAAGPRAAVMVNRAAATLTSQGPAELRHLLNERHGRHHGPPLLVVNRAGKELFGRPLPPGSLTHARSLARLGAVTPGEPAVRLVAIDNEEYLLFVPIPPRAAAGGRGPPAPWLLIVTGLLASLGFSTLLAWYFAKPLGHLRAAFTAAAEGRLDERVQPRMGSRRDEIADLGRHFDAMASRLQTLLGAQRQLLHDVSHELRSPLARLQAAAGLARQDPACLDTTLERIERETMRLDTLVGELLTLSRLEAGVNDTKRDTVDVSELLASIAEDARFEAQASGRNLCFDAPPEEQRMEAHAELLHRAFENVIRNAIRFTAPGTAVEVSLRSTAQGTLSVQVCDRGPGLPETDLQAIFQPFYRGHRGASGRSADGFGLGLAIAQRAVERHGGHIVARNREGGGLCMKIMLPLRMDAEAGAGRCAQP